MLTPGGLGRRRSNGNETPVELRFVDMLLIVIATLMFVAVLLGVASLAPGSRANAALRITTASAPAALAGQRYELKLAANGGDGNYIWHLSAGALPTGLSLLTDGTIEGTSPQPETGQATVVVTDGQQHSDSKELVFAVRPFGTQTRPELITPRVKSRLLLLPDAFAGEPYQYDFAGELGTPPYRWSVAGGSFPGGIELTGAGNLVGRAHSPGTYSFSVSITDAAGTVVTQDGRLLVADPPPTVWQRIIDRLAWGLQWLLWFLGALVVLSWIIPLLFGRTGGVIEVKERRGVISGLFRRR